MSTEYDRRYRRWYSDEARTYDNRFAGDFAALESEYIVELLKPRGGTRILDVGTGTGRGALPVAQHADAEVFGLDITPGMMARAAAKRDEADMRFPQFVCGNAKQLPFANSTFDAVLSIRVLHLFPTPFLGAFVDEMRRVLKPGGTLLIEFNSPLAGLGWSLVREVGRRRRGDKARHFLWPQHIDALFAGMDDVQVYGYWLPGIGRVAERGGVFSNALRLAKLRPPFGFLGDKVLIRAHKPRTVSQNGYVSQSVERDAVPA